MSTGVFFTDVMTEVKLMWLLAHGATSYQAVARGLLHDDIGEVTPLTYTRR